MPRTSCRHGIAVFLRLAAILATTFPAIGCAPARVLNALVPGEGYRVEQGIAYGREARQRLDVYAPRQGGNGDVVVFLHGGAWQFGDKADYRYMGEALTARGLIAVLPNYRLYPEVRFPAFVEDAAAALAWTQSHIAGFGGRPQRIFVMGHSAGAHLAALLACDPRYLAAHDLGRDSIAGLIGLAGPYDLPAFQSGIYHDIFASRPHPETQPITYAGAGCPPMLLLAGADDLRVAPRNSVAMAQRVRAAGGSAEAQIIDRIGHAGIILAFARPLRWLAPVLERSLAFIAGQPGEAVAASSRHPRPRPRRQQAAGGAAGKPQRQG